ncbi:MAG TPA: DUF1631 domain-containing protein [Xanthomonadales bacterium]|nr:DUF1631 domain-containing protein [Xanthomonadales bacterium]
MVSGSPPGNVVELSQAARGDSPRIPAGKIIAIVRGTAQKRLSALANALFERVDDALFDMAERAASNANQARFFDGMREIRKKRHAAELAFLEALSKSFGDYEMGKLAPTAAELGGGDARRGKEPMALVEESELEESLAIAAMVDKADSRLTRPLFALSARFAALLGNSREVDQANNPLGPRLLSQHFSGAMREFDVDLQVKLIVLKLFERHVLAELEPVYEETNGLMVGAGVLPQLKYQVPARKPGDPPPPKAEQKAPEPEHPDDHATYGRDGEIEVSSTESEIASLVSELHTLLSARRPRPVGSSTAYAGHPTPGMATHGAHAPVASPQELLNALSLMQNEMGMQALPSRPMATPLPVAPSRVKHELVEHMRRLGGGARASQLGSDEDTIDLVGMLFDFAVQDRNLPAPIQALLGRLQIPYLKVALMDRDFVARKSHPARRLLDDVAQACVGWSEESDKDQRLYNKVQEVVSTLLRDFDDDTAVFEKLNTDFNDFVDKNRKRAELVERRTAEAARGREKLESAQRTAARSILNKVSGRSLPGNVRDLLTRRWSNYLVLTYLRHGEDSPEFKSAERFVEDFAWSVEPKSREQERVRLRDMMPQLESTLRQGLAATGFHEGHLDELWKEIEEIYEQQIMGDEPPAAVAQAMQEAAAATEAMSIRFASSKAGEEVVFDARQIEDTMSDQAALDALDTWLKIARALKTGTWFEFIRDDGSRERAKLLWISTIRALYLFVNRNGLKIAEKTASELAEELKEQKAVILEQVALVDRALQAILEQLRQSNADKDKAGATSENAGKPSDAPVPAASGPPQAKQMPPVHGAAANEPGRTPLKT